MAEREDLERRVAELERQLAATRPSLRGVRYRSGAALGDLPWVSIALGPDRARGERRGFARGVIAIGDVAVGVVAVGGAAAGGICFGGVSLGLASLGGLALGLWVAVGGLAVGGTALGGAALGRVAIGGAAAGEYACGGAGFGRHVIDATGVDSEAAAFLREKGLAPLCPALALSRAAGPPERGPGR